MSNREFELASIRYEGETAAEIEIDDNEIVVFQTRFPSGVRDFVLHQRIDRQTYQVLNPLELLGTRMAVQVLNAIGQQSSEIAAQFSLSRLLVQCLEYRGNRRHLVVEPWDVEDLSGERLFEGNRTDFARDCGHRQANRFQLILTGAEESELPARDLYWGTFSTLPTVADMFDDSDLGLLAMELLTRIEGEGVGDVDVQIPQLRSMISSSWRNHFCDFDLDIPKKQRRSLFKKLMSVAVRQSSTMTRQIAFAFTTKPLGLQARSDFQLTGREERLFEIRYGSYRPLGNINVGFLYGDGELHSDLINDLGRALVGSDSDAGANVEVAEENLYRHIQALSELRDIRREVRAEQRRSTRSNRTRKLPRPRVQVDNQEDASSPQPDVNLVAHEGLVELERLLPLLKPRDRERVEALIATGGDKRSAAELRGEDPVAFMRRYKQTTQKNINIIKAQLRQQEGPEE